MHAMRDGKYDSAETPTAATASDRHAFFTSTMRLIAIREQLESAIAVATATSVLRAAAEISIARTRQ